MTPPTGIESTTPRLRSMTGFGESERDVEGALLRIEIRSVNHRFLNVQMRTPPGFERVEAALERRLRDFFVRGHVKVTITIDEGATASGQPLAIDVDRARRWVEALRALQTELGLSGSVDVGTLARFRDVFTMPDGRRSPSEVPEDVLLESLGHAAGQVVVMREEEGARLAADLLGRVDAMEGEVEGIRARAPERLVAERDRLRAAVVDLLDGRIPVDEDRIAREIAHLAERWDIHEEVVRFGSHLAMFRETLASSDPPGIGKRLGFIAQELLREANTMGSKANDAEIAARVVKVKEEIERLREQLENVE